MKVLNVMRLNERKSVVLDGFEWRCQKKGFTTIEGDGYLYCHGVQKEVTVQIKQTIEFILAGTRCNTGLRTFPTGDELCFYTLRNIREIPSMHSKE
ncbi:hypothetical protein TNCV_4982311 [Trichonephila clavipes]|nr:hypothetical protein TNCV_4982311 [Trichonephila clavipes]